MPPNEIEHFWAEIDSNPAHAVLYYVELLKLTLDMVKANYPKNIFRVRKAINTLYVMANEAQ